MEYEQARQTIARFLAEVKRTGKKLEGAERAAMFRAYDAVNAHHRQTEPRTGIMALLAYGPLCLNGGSPPTSEDSEVCWLCGCTHH